MEQTLKINVMRGAGISFMVSAILFVFTENPLWFGLVLLGPLAGIAIGWGTEHFSGLKGQIAAALRSVGRFFSFLGRYLFHDNLAVRVISLLGVGALLVLLAWMVGYALLPEGALSAGGQVNHVDLSRTPVEEWLVIYRHNLFTAAVIVLGSLLVRVNRVPLGYITIFYNLTLYGLFIGSNSFAIPYPERLAPTLAIFERSGPYEMMALCLLAAAAARWSRFEIKQIFQSNLEAVRPAARVRVVEVVAVLAGLNLLGAANWIEAVMIVS